MQTQRLPLANGSASQIAVKASEQCPEWHDSLASVRTTVQYAPHLWKVRMRGASMKPPAESCLLRMNIENDHSWQKLALIGACIYGTCCAVAPVL
jgi:hypothetical protein